MQLKQRPVQCAHLELHTGHVGGIVDLLTTVEVGYDEYKGCDVIGGSDGSRKKLFGRACWIISRFL